MPPEHRGTTGKNTVVLRYFRWEIGWNFVQTLFSLNRIIMSETSTQGSGHRITLQQAVEMTTRYRQEKAAILKPEYNSDILARAETFSRSAFDELLGQKGCVSIRAYYGMDEKKNVKLLFVGVNAENEDMLPSEKNGLNGEASIQDVGQRCPPICGKQSPLNP